MKKPSELKISQRHSFRGMVLLWLCQGEYKIKSSRGYKCFHTWFPQCNHYYSSQRQPPKHHTQGVCPHRALETAGGEPSLAITCATSAAVDLKTSTVLLFCYALQHRPIYRFSLIIFHFRILSLVFILVEFKE